MLLNQQCEDCITSYGWKLCKYLSCMRYEFGMGCVHCGICINAFVLHLALHCSSPSKLCKDLSCITCEFGMRCVHCSIYMNAIVLHLTLHCSSPSNLHSVPPDSSLVAARRSGSGPVTPTAFVSYTSHPPTHVTIRRMWTQAESGGGCIY